MCGLNGNGFVEIERALENGMSVNLPKDTHFTRPNGVFKVMESDVGERTMNVMINVPLHVEGGGHVVICGDSEEMGSWKLDNALRLTSAGNMWTVQTPLPPGHYEFKCVIVGVGDPQWEPGNNRVLQVATPASNNSEMEVTLDFGQTGSSSVTKILRETVVMTPNGDELFRMVGGNGIDKLNRMMNLTLPSTEYIPRPMSEIHDVISYPLTEEVPTANAFLERELKLEPEELKQMRRRFPDLRFKSVRQELQPWLDFFLDEIGMRRVHLVKLLIKRPSLLDVPKSDVKPIADYFVHELGVTPKQFFLLLIRRPGVFHLSMESDIEPKVRLLRALTDLDDAGIGRLLVGCRDLLSKEDGEIQRRIHNLCMHLRLDGVRCSDLMLRYPAVLSMRPETVARKVTYLTKMLGRSVHEIIEFPFCLSFSLDRRVIKRFQYLDNVGIPHQTYGLATVLRPKEERFFKMVDRQVIKSKTHLVRPSPLSLTPNT